MTTEMPKLLSKTEVINLLMVSDRTLEKLVGARKFPPPLRLGKTVRWAETAVKAWLDRQLEPQLTWEPPVRRSVRPVKS